MASHSVKSLLDMISTPFVLVKGSTYDIEEGHDIDIFALDSMQLVRELLHLSSSYINSGWALRVSNMDSHYHIDYIQEDKLIFRIDIIGSLDIFKSKLLENDKYAQLAFRLFEYSIRPDKKKHLDYVKENL